MDDFELKICAFILITQLAESLSMVRSVLECNEIFLGLYTLYAGQYIVWWIITVMADCTELLV